MAPIDAELTNERIQAEVRDYILREFLAGTSPDELEMETPLITGGVLDSIATVILVSFLEGEYGVEFRPHEMDPDYLDTIELIARTVMAKRS